MTVAEAFLEATAPPPRDALDPAVLTAGGLCDAARALLDPALDGGWAQRARERLASAERLAGFFDAAPARARVEALLARRGLREPWSTAGLIGALGRRHELAARRSQGSDTARLHLAAAERLRRLAGE